MDYTYLWEKGIQAGYDPEQSKWRLKGGQFCAREEALGERHPEAVFGSVVQLNRAPMSAMFERMEMVLGGIAYDSLINIAQRAEHMPPEILAAMRLSEYYLRTEGDLWETIVVPIELALRPIEIQSSDKAVEKELQEIYDRIEINQLLLWNWLCAEIYGQSFPLEVWDGKELAGVVVLDPKYMKVGRQFVYSSLSMVPPEGGWDRLALEEQIHPMMYDSLGSDWNEQAAHGKDIPIKRERCYPLSDLKLPFQRYAIPSPSRCFRPLSTRQIVEEMQRATIEGFRNQLWVFKAGSDDKPASPAEIAHLRGQIGGMAGERTGYLVWNHNLVVEQHAPKSLDVVMGNEMWLSLTLHIYRQRGMNLRLTSGESPTTSRAGDTEWDVQLFLERMKFKRLQILNWEKHLRQAIGATKGKNWQKADVLVHMMKPDMELQNLVKLQLQPLGQAGWLSVRSILERAGYSFDIELQRKLAEEEFGYLFAPKPTFAQSTTFNTPKEVVETPTGRPPGATDKVPREERIDASITVFAQDDRFDIYVGRVFNLYDMAVQSPSRGAVDTFVEGLKAINSEEMMGFARMGYITGGGTFEADPDWIGGAVNFVNGFTEKLRGDLYDMVDAGRNLDDLRWRIYLYPQEGRHLAYMWGMQQAMKEHGARGWRRVLHPELSEVGPCDACIADSQIIHPISEGFWEPHPNGVCTSQSVAYYTSPTQLPIEIPVPRKFTLPDEIRKLLERLGRIGKTIIRRIRSD